MRHKEQSRINFNTNNRTQNLPITFHPITFLQQNFRSNIIWCTNGRISLCHLYIHIYKLQYTKKRNSIDHRVSIFIITYCHSNCNKYNSDHDLIEMNLQVSSYFSASFPTVLVVYVLEMHDHHFVLFHLHSGQ